MSYSIHPFFVGWRTSNNLAAWLLPPTQRYKSSRPLRVTTLHHRIHSPTITVLVVLVLVLVRPPPPPPQPSIHHSHINDRCISHPPIKRQILPCLRRLDTSLHHSSTARAGSNSNPPPPARCPPLRPHPICSNARQ